MTDLPKLTIYAPDGSYCAIDGVYYDRRQAPQGPVAWRYRYPIAGGSGWSNWYLFDNEPDAKLSEEVEPLYTLPGAPQSGQAPQAVWTTVGFAQEVCRIAGRDPYENIAAADGATWPLWEEVSHRLTAKFGAAPQAEPVRWEVRHHGDNGYVSQWNVCHNDVDRPERSGRWRCEYRPLYAAPQAGGKDADALLAAPTSGNIARTPAWRESVGNLPATRPEELRFSWVCTVCGNSNSPAVERCTHKDTPHHVIGLGNPAAPQALLRDVPELVARIMHWVDRYDCGLTGDDLPDRIEHEVRAHLTAMPQLTGRRHDDHDGK